MDISPGYTPLNATVLFPRSVQVQEQNDHFHTVWRDWTNMYNQTLVASVQGQFRPLAMESTRGTVKQSRTCSAQIQTELSLWAHYWFWLQWQQPPSPSQEQAGICVLSSVPKKGYEQQQQKKSHFHLAFHMNSLVLPDPDTLAAWCRTSAWVSNTKWNVSTTLSRNHLASTVTTIYNNWTSPIPLHFQ